MSREEIENMWDDCRDGTLSGEDRRRFDECMIDDRDMASLWGAESRWLSQLATTPSKTDAVDGPSFTEQVLDAWEQQRRRVIVRKMRWRSGIFAGGWAALLAIAATVMWANLPAAVAPQPPAERYLSRSQYTPQIIATDPVTELVKDVSYQYNAAPAALYDALEEGPRIFSVRGALDALVSRPSPDRFMREYENDYWSDQQDSAPVLLRGSQPR